MLGSSGKLSRQKLENHETITRFLFKIIAPRHRYEPSITDGVHRNENFEEIIPVFSTFSNFFKQNKKKFIKAILCNFSMRFLKYF